MTEDNRFPAGTEYELKVRFSVDNYDIDFDKINLLDVRDYVAKYVGAMLAESTATLADFRSGKYAVSTPIDVSLVPLVELDPDFLEKLLGGNDE